MSSTSLADQLEDAIEIMIAEPHSAPPRIDLRIGELLGIAAELRLVPDPEFRAALKTELLEEPHITGSVAQIATPTWRSAAAPAQRGLGANVDNVLPTLFGHGYGNYPVHRGNFAISVALHAALVAIVATTGLWFTRTQQIRHHAHSVLVTEISPYVLPPSAGESRGGGGGGDRDFLPESKGSLPRFTREQISAPAIVVRNEEPKLPAEPTVIGPPTLTMPPTSRVGNPLSGILQPLSNGTGSGGGIGSGTGGGIGSGHGSGVGPGMGGGIGGGVYRVGGGVSAPRAIYDPDPEYSEEARKAKFQGTVLLWVIVGPEGRPRSIRVARALGMGLDEKAIEAVRNWKFEPARKDGQPVAVQVNIEVSFRLY